jgi:hypothetical protein
VAGAARTEGEAGVERHPAAVQEGLRRVVAEAERAAVEPGQVGGLARTVADRGEVLGQQAGEQAPVVVEAGQEGVQPGGAVAQGGGVGDDAEVARAVPDLLGQPRARRGRARP